MEEQTMRFRAVEIELASREFSVALGNSVEIPYTATNRTGEDGYFEITVRGIPSGWLLLDLPVLHLGVNERRKAHLTIQTPANSPVSVGEYPVTIEATSQENADWRGEGQFTLRVFEYEATRTVSPVDTGERVGLFLNTAQFTASPGETLSIPVVIANRGMHEETFFLAVEGLSPSWVSAATPSVRLLPGEHREVVLYVHPPAGPDGRAGRHTFSIRVVAQSDSNIYAAADAVLTVVAASQFSTDLHPRRIDAGQNARVRIQNQGNLQETFTLRFQSNEGVLDFVASQTGPLRLMPGESVVVEIAVSPRTPNWFGRPETMSYSVFVQSSQGAVQGHNGEVVSHPLIPIWVLPALLTLCVAMLCGFGFLWNWNQNRLSNAQETANAQVGLIGAQTATAVQSATDAAALAETFAVATALNNATAAAEVTAAAATASAANEATASAEGTAASVAVLAQTQTAVAVLSLTPPTAAPSPTDTPLPPTNTPVPSPTTPPQPTATNTPAPTATVFSLPVTGQQVFLFASNRAGGNPQVFLLNSANGGPKELVSDAGSDTQPAWSPDGNLVLFTSNRDGNNEVYIMAADGSNLKNLTNNPASDSFPAWSPDGDKIAFVSDRDGNNEIYIMNPDGSNPVNITNNPSNDYKPAWYEQRSLLSTTSGILFTTDRDGNNEIYKMDPDGSNPVNLTKNPASDSLPAVPFNGGSIAFTTDRDGNQEIYRMELDGSKTVNVTNNPSGDTKPAWSQDGNWIAFTTDRDGNREIYIISKNGEDATNISRSPADDFDPSWR